MTLSLEDSLQSVILGLILVNLRYILLNHLNMLQMKQQPAISYVKIELFQKLFPTFPWHVSGLI